MINYTLMFVVACIVGFILYRQIQKISDRADEEEIMQNDPARYVKFCDTIDRNLRSLSDSIKNEDVLEQNANEDEILNQIANFSREITFIQTSHSTNENPKIWENKLFEFLNKVDNFISQNFKNGNEVADKFRQNLMNEFQNL